MCGTGALGLKKGGACPGGFQYTRGCDDTPDGLKNGTTGRNGSGRAVLSLHCRAGTGEEKKLRDPLQAGWLS